MVIGSLCSMKERGNVFYKRKFYKLYGGNLHAKMPGAGQSLV